MAHPLGVAVSVAARCQLVACRFLRSVVDPQEGQVAQLMAIVGRVPVLRLGGRSGHLCPAILGVPGAVAAVERHCQETLGVVDPSGVSLVLQESHFSSLLVAEGTFRNLLLVDLPLPAPLPS